MDRCCSWDPPECWEALANVGAETVISGEVDQDTTLGKEANNELLRYRFAWRAYLRRRVSVDTNDVYGWVQRSLSLSLSRTSFYSRLFLPTLIPLRY